jgi:hypothetical protein
VCNKGWLPKWEALRHDTTGKQHVRAVRAFNALPSEPTAPADSTEPQDAYGAKGPVYAACSLENDTHRLHTVHGPALNDDPPDMLYDDFSGSIAQSQLPPDAPGVTLLSEQAESRVYDDVVPEMVDIGVSESRRTARMVRTPHRF